MSWDRAEWVVQGCELNVGFSEVAYKEAIIQKITNTFSTNNILQESKQHTPREQIYSRRLIG